jgi:hypothetical protein
MQAQVTIPSSGGPKSDCRRPALPVVAQRRFLRLAEKVRSADALLAALASPGQGD